MMENFICWLIGHDLRGSTDDEIKQAAEELHAGKRTMAELPMSICRRCDVHWGTAFNVPIRKPQ